MIKINCSATLPKYYRSQTKLREGNVFTGVCLSMGSVHQPLSSPPPSRYMGHGILWDMVDKWAVRVLQECLLVFFYVLKVVFQITFVGFCDLNFLYLSCSTQYWVNILFESKLDAEILGNTSVNLNPKRPTNVYLGYPESHSLNWNTRMHSSRKCTVRNSCHLLRGGAWSGGACSRGGACSWGGGGACSGGVCS